MMIPHLLIDIDQFEDMPKIVQYDKWGPWAHGGEKGSEKGRGSRER